MEAAATPTIEGRRNAERTSKPIAPNRAEIASRFVLVDDTFNFVYESMDVV